MSNTIYISTEKAKEKILKMGKINANEIRHNHILEPNWRYWFRALSELVEQKIAIQSGSKKNIVYTIQP